MSKFFFQIVGNSFAYFGPRSLHKRRLSKTNATMQKQPCFSAKLVIRKVLSGQCTQGDPGLCWGSSAFLIGDLTLHDQWHSSECRCQSPCSGGFIFDHDFLQQSVNCCGVDNRVCCEYRLSEKSRRSLYFPDRNKVTVQARSGEL